MSAIARRIKAIFADPARVSVCGTCETVSICDTACRAGAAQDRAMTRYLSLGLPR